MHLKHLFDQTLILDLIVIFAVVHQLKVVDMIAGILTVRITRMFARDATIQDAINIYSR